MANYNALKSSIQEVIRTNGDNEITGALLQQILLAIVNALGVGYQYAGLAVPATNPGTPDQNVFYLAGEPGTYSNFGFTVGYGELAVFTYSGTWIKQSIPLPGDGAPDLALYKAIKYNLYNPNDIDNKPGYYLDGFGNLVANASYLTTGYIPFSKSMGSLIPSVNGTDVLDFGGFMCLYDANKTLIRAVAESTNAFVDWDDNVVYARFSMPNYTNGNLQVETGTVVTPYMEPGKYYISNAVYIDGRRIIENSLPGEKVIDATLTPKKCTFFRFNLFNPNDPDNAPGYYLDMWGGLASNANYLATGYIPFSSGTICASVNGQTGAGGGFIVLYDSQKNVVAAIRGDSTGNVATWQDNVAFVRFSIAGYSAGNIQVEPGSVITEYVPFGEYRLDGQFAASNPQLESLLGQQAGRITQSALAANTELTLGNYPYHNKKGDALSMYAGIGAFSNLYVGKGRNQYRGRWLKITATDIVLQRYESSVIDVVTVAHGLTISTFVQLSMESDADGVLHLALNSISGTFQHDFPQWDYEANYDPFVYCDGALTNVVLNATNTDYRCPVWAFGDSYFGVNVGRWPGWVFQFGYKNFLINGLAGQNSAGAFVDLKKALNYGTPKYLLWCLGMNDTDANYEYYFEQVRAICEQKDVTLVAAKIPSVPGRNKETINSYIDESGVRFIDFYKAVGANSSGQWYAGFLSDDNLHPSALGAQALAVRVLVDFPELMQYGIK